MTKYYHWVLFDEVGQRLAETLAYLRQVGPVTVLPISNRAELKRKLEEPIPTSQPPDLDGKGLFLSIDSGFSEVSALIANYRKMAPASPIIVSVDKISTETLADLVRSGVSQVIHHGYNEESLAAKIKLAISFQTQVALEQKLGTAMAPGKIWAEDWRQDSIIVKVLGWTSEHCVFPPLTKREGQNSIIFDCDRQSGINSLGIRLLILWLKTIDSLGFNEIIFENVRRPMLRVLSSIKAGFNLKHRVNSFYLTYYSPDSGNEIDKLIVRNKDFDEKMFRIQKTTTQIENGKSVKYVLDDSIRSNLAFMSTKIEIV